MGINHEQLRSQIIRPVLVGIGMWSAAAENLVLGTAIQESDGGEYLVQIGGGPAAGIYQMEPATAYDVLIRYLNGSRPDLHKKIDKIVNLNMPDGHSDEAFRKRLIRDLGFATALCRVKYWMSPSPLPHEDDVEGLAKIWKSVYNTELGAGTVPQFIFNYKKYLKDA